jgi:alkylhydroperoxidase family enzyme
MTEPRIQPLPRNEWTEEMRELLALPLEGHKSDEVPEFLTTLVRHPGLYRRYAGLSGKLLTRGKLAPRDRELAILRGAWLCKAAYEWGEHVRIAHEIGFSLDDIEHIIAGPDHPAWNAHERAVVRTVDELHCNAMITDDTWATLSATLDEKQLIELTMAVGAYHMIAYLQNGLRVRLRSTNAGLAAR